VIEEETHKVIGIVTRGDIIRDMAKSEVWSAVNFSLIPP
jgi:hypothetical protein